MKRSRFIKFGMLFPALTWLLTQFAMTGMIVGTPVNAMQIEICSSYGTTQILIDPETGEPVEQVITGGCDWCQSFGVAVTGTARGDVSWSALEYGFQTRASMAADLDPPLRLTASFQSRAPPTL
ncbi:hypothetical protein [Roseovarius sp. 2305UL8-3]|uniref:hypothetical protein n=1 Tax=Roseovarius conchicola TaxID=3121636 RepID=UPI00352835A3